MKGLIFATLAMTLLGGTVAQANPANEPAMIGKITGKTFYAADGSSLSFLAYQGGMAREIHTANGAVLIETLALTNGNGGTVATADSGSAPAGTFKLTATALVTDYRDGHSEMLSPNGAGGMEITSRSAAGDVMCTAWYPQGHRFSPAEMNAALIDVAARLDLNETAHHSCDSVTTREAHTHGRRHVAQGNAAVVARLPE